MAKRRKTRGSPRGGQTPGTGRREAACPKTDLAQRAASEFEASAAILEALAESPNIRVLEEVVDDDFRNRLVWIARRIIRARTGTGAEGAVQEALTAAASNGSKLAEADDPRAYLRVAVRRRAADRCRERSKSVSLDGDLDGARLRSSAPSVEVAYLYAEDVTAALPARLRPIWVRRLRGMTLPEIAEDLRQPLRTIERRWAELKAIMRALLGGENDDTEVGE